ncbi:MAG: hypothetical protein GXO97_00150 [Nitrospirae bacterium]|nr:hypothetical protein [Nitrospirota bacterium]
MKTSHMFLIICLIAILGFLVGYSIAPSNVESLGFSTEVESAGYGGGGEEIEQIKGLSKEMQKYYKELEESEE